MNSIRRRSSHGGADVGIPVPISEPVILEQPEQEIDLPFDFVDNLSPDELRKIMRGWQQRAARAERWALVLAESLEGTRHVNKVLQNMIDTHISLAFGRESRAMFPDHWRGEDFVRVHTPHPRVKGDYSREEKLFLANGRIVAERRCSSHLIEKSEPLKPKVDQSLHNAAIRAVASSRRRNVATTSTSRRNRTIVEHSRRALFHIATCAYCGKEGDERNGPDGKPWHMDHVMPLSRGGEDCVTNIVKACAWCNLSKGQKIQSPLDGTPTAAAMLHRSLTLVES